jgi:hypothetical protein
MRSCVGYPIAPMVAIDRTPAPVKAEVVSVAAPVVHRLAARNEVALELLMHAAVVRLRRSLEPKIRACSRASIGG